MPSIGGEVATTGTFGQVWNLLFDEWQDAIVASLQAVNKRVPLMLGVTSANPREITKPPPVEADDGDAKRGRRSRRR